MSTPDTETATDPDSEGVRFSTLGLDPDVLPVLDEMGFEFATPIQAAAIPALLGGKDILGRARTGSGKTAAFGLPLLERVYASEGRGVKALVLAPTRELAVQVTDVLRSLAVHGLEAVTLYGGTPYPPQLRALRAGVPIVVGTPGRVIDHLKRGTLDLSGLEMLVLDEADEMLRMGFIDDVETIIEAANPKRQVALFSATMPKEIRRITKRFLTDPINVEVEDGPGPMVDHIRQLWVRVPQRNKWDALERVLAVADIEAALIFTRTRQGCADTAEELRRRGLPVEPLHGELNQISRERVLNRLREKQTRFVVATEVASRGIDVQHISHVINLDIPETNEAYTHRIGRTGRAGRDGVALTFVTPSQGHRLRSLQNGLGATITEWKVPSDADIQGRQRKALLAEVTEAGASLDTTWAKACIQELLEAEGADAEDIAAAVLTILASSRQLPMDLNPDDKPPAWAQTRSRTKERPDRKPGKRQRGDSGGQVDNEVELFLPVGKRHGVRASDLVGALANETGIPGNLIGRVSIFETTSFIGMSRRDAEKVLNRATQLEIRGRWTPISPARPRRPRR